MTTDRLIEALARNITPAAALARPWARASWWLLGTVAYLTALTLMTASPAEMAANGRPRLFDHMAAILTAAIAARTAFASTVPGVPRRIFLVSAAAIIWLGNLARGAVQHWSSDGASLAAAAEPRCVVFMLFGAALPAVAISIMLRRGAPLTPALTAGMGMLASAALASVAGCLSHLHPNDAVTLVWHGVTIAGLVSLAVLGSHFVLNWNNADRRRRTHP